MFTEQIVQVPKHDHDVHIVFPGGKRMTIQLRPSNADQLPDGRIYNGSLDIILAEQSCVTCWIGEDMEAGPQAGNTHERLSDQLVMELPGDYE